MNTISSRSLQRPLPGELMDAVRHGSTDRVKRLLEEGADVNETDSGGSSVLSLAVSHGYVDITRLLVSKNANIDSRNAHGDTPLMVAISSYATTNRDVIVSELLDKGANINIRNNDGDTAMSLAVKQTHPQIVKLIKEAIASRKRLATEYAKAAEDRRRAAIAEKQKQLRDMAKHKPKPKLGPKPPKAA